MHTIVCFVHTKRRYGDQVCVHFVERLDAGYAYEIVHNHPFLGGNKRSVLNSLCLEISESIPEIQGESLP